MIYCSHTSIIPCTWQIKPESFFFLYHTKSNVLNSAIITKQTQSKTLTNLNIVAHGFAFGREKSALSLRFPCAGKLPSGKAFTLKSHTHTQFNTSTQSPDRARSRHLDRFTAKKELTLAGTYRRLLYEGPLVRACGTQREPWEPKSHPLTLPSFPRTSLAPCFHHAR